MISIRRRLTSWLLPGLLLMLLVGAATEYFSIRSVLFSEFDDALNIKVKALMSLVKWEDGRTEFDFSDESMPEFQRNDRSAYFQLRGPDGSSLERSASLGSIDLPARTGPVIAPDFWNLMLPDGRVGRAVGIRFLPLVDAEDEDGRPVDTAARAEVTLVVAQDRTDLESALTRIGMAMALVGLSMLVVTAAIVKFAVRRGLSPLDALGARVGAIEVSSLSERFATEAMPAELKPICVRLNEFLARLEESFRRERRFSADVSHELRTPIAELRSLAEVALKYPEEGAVASRAFGDALDIAVQMERIVSSLLLIARCQSGQQAVSRQTVRIADLVETAWRPLEAAAEKKRLVRSMELPRDLTVNTDPAILQPIIQNLLSNAVSHTPDGGRVRVFVSRDHGRFEFEVTNTNASLTPDDLPRLFEPFWRKDASRSDSSHSGLGLTLASECARLLAMEIAAELGPQNELRMTLRSG